MSDPRKFASYEEVERAFMQQMEYATFHSCEAANDAQHVRATFQPNPFRSCLIEGCLERGIDYRNGGPLYGHGQVLAEAIADTGDSLWAIKKLVFIEKRYTMEQLINNFGIPGEVNMPLWDLLGVGYNKFQNSNTARCVGCSGYGCRVGH